MRWLCIMKDDQRIEPIIHYAKNLWGRGVSFITFFLPILYFLTSPLWGDYAEKSALAVAGPAGAFIANTVTNQAVDLGVDPSTAQKMGAIASALPAFWDDYQLHIGSASGQASAAATAQSHSRKLSEKLIQEQQAEDLKRLEEALQKQAEVEKQSTTQRKKQRAPHFTAQQKAKVVSALSNTPFVVADDQDKNTSLLGALHSQETQIHTQQQMRESLARHAIEHVKTVERGRVHGGHRRSLSGDIYTLKAAVHMGAQQTWNILAEQEAQQFATMGYLNGSMNFRGGGSDMPAVPMVLPEPVYNTQAARKAFRTGLMGGHGDVRESGKHLIDYAIPGGIDYGLAYAKGEISRTQLIQCQSAAIAGELAAGYVAGKIVKGVAKGVQHAVQLTKGLGAKTSGALGHGAGQTAGHSTRMGHGAEAAASHPMPVGQAASDPVAIQHVKRAHSAPRSLGEQIMGGEGKAPLGGAIRANSIVDGSKLEYIAPGRVKFDGVEFRAVRDLGHLDDRSLKRMLDDGVNPRDIFGNRLDGHHFNQDYHRNPNAFIVEIPQKNHSIGNTIQHPLGTAGGLSQTERQDWNRLRKLFNKERARTELLKRGIHE